MTEMPAVHALEDGCQDLRMTAVTVPCEQVKKHVGFPGAVSMEGKERKAMGSTYRKSDTLPDRCRTADSYGFGARLGRIDFDAAGWRWYRERGDLWSEQERMDSSWHPRWTCHVRYRLWMF